MYHLDGSRAWVTHLCRLGTSLSAGHITGPNHVQHRHCCLLWCSTTCSLWRLVHFCKSPVAVQQNPDPSWNYMPGVCNTDVKVQANPLTNPFLHLLARAFLLWNRWDQWEGALEEHCDANEMQSLYPSAAPYHEDVSTERRNSTKHLQTSVFQRLDPTPRHPNTSWEGVLGCFRYVFGVQIPSQEYLDV